jgi:transposase
MQGRVHEEETMDPVVQPASQPDSQPRTKRSYRSAEERRRIVEETLAPGVSVAKVAQAHGVNANQVFAWRKLHLAGKLRDRWSKSIRPSAAHGLPATTALAEVSTSRVRLLPVSVSAEVEQPPAVIAMSGRGDGLTSAGSIELTLPKMQVRITGQVDAAVLRLVLECLRG